VLIRSIVFNVLFYLNLSVSAGNLDKPNTIIICSRMCDLQLGNLNTRKLGSEPLNNMMNVSRHTRMAKR